MLGYLVLSKNDENKINDYMPDEKAINKIALYFQNFSDSTRVKIISCLSMCDMCVNDLSIVLSINQTTVSHQLKLLKDQNIVSCKRNGKIIMYSLCNKGINDLMYLAVLNS